MAVGRINEVAMRMYGRFAGVKNIGRNNEVAILTRWPQGGFHCTVYWVLNSHLSPRVLMLLVLALEILLYSMTITLHITSRSLHSSY